MEKYLHKLLLIAFTLLLCANSYGQSHPPTIPQGVKQQMTENIGGFMADSAMGLPIRGLFPSTTSFIYRKGQEFYDTANLKVYTWNGVNWIKQADSLDLIPLTSAETYSLSFPVGDSGNSVTITALINKQILQLSIGGSIVNPFFFTNSTGKFDFTSMGGIYNTTLIILYKN
jgi:hypothetical protein